MSYSTNTPKASLDDIIRLTAFQVGDKFDHLRQSFADVSYIALRNWLVSVARLNPEDDKYKEFFTVLDSYIKLTEIYQVQHSSESTKLVLKVAGSLKKDFKERKSLY